MIALTLYQNRKLEIYVMDVWSLNEKDKNLKPKRYPYCGKESRMIKKGFKNGKQYYACKDCSYIFTYNSHTITIYSKIERSI